MSTCTNCSKNGKKTAYLNKCKNIWCESEYKPNATAEQYPSQPKLF